MPRWPATKMRSAGVIRAGMVGWDENERSGDSNQTDLQRPDALKAACRASGVRNRWLARSCVAQLASTFPQQGGRFLGTHEDDVAADELAVSSGSTKRSARRSLEGLQLLQR